MKRNIIFFALLATLLAALAWVIWPQQEPRFRGGRASFWVDEPGYDETIFGYFPNADSNAVPFLIKGLSRQRGSLPGISAAIYNHGPAWLQRHMRPPREFKDWMVRASAAEVLGNIATNSPAAISALIRTVKRDQNPTVRVYAIEALQKIGHGNDAVKKAVLDALQDAAPEVRDAADDAIRQLDPAAAKTLKK